MDWEQTRQQVDENLMRERQGHATDEEWQKACSHPRVQALAFGPTPEEDVAAEAAIIISSARWMAGSEQRLPRRSVPRRSDPLSRPPWWEMESQRRLDTLSWARDLMRWFAGLDEASISSPLPPTWPPAAVEPLGNVAEIEPLVHNLVSERWLRYESLEPPWGLEGDTFEHHAQIEFPRETWEQDRSTVRYHFLPAGFAGVRQSWASLDRLATLSAWMADELGISQAEALVWGLTDFPFTIPWMPTIIGGNSGSWPMVTIQVNSMNATAPEVARAYTLARAQRPTRPWPALVVAFVKQRAVERERRLFFANADEQNTASAGPGDTWDERFRAFASAYPDQKYKSMQTFRQAYYDQKKKEGKRQGGSHEETR